MRVVNCYAIVGTVLVVVAVIIWLRERDFKNTLTTLKESHAHSIAVLEAQRATLNQEVESLLDRLFASKNLPPAQVPMKDIFEKQEKVREEQRLERRNGGPVRANAIGPVDDAQRLMAKDVRRRSDDLQRDIDEKRNKQLAANAG